MAVRRIGLVTCLALTAVMAEIGCDSYGPPKDDAAPATDVRQLARASLAQIDGRLQLAGLREPVEVIRDEWGVPHIYARNTEDLFFAQGYVMAQDRLWEMEWWRRGLEGRLAEVLGPKAFERDRLARLLRYRGPFDDTEWTSYHAEGKGIFTAYANGINAYITTHAESLPVEFRLTGIKPLPWTAETVALREPSFGNAVQELRLAMDVAKYGVKEANRRAAPDPWDDLTVPDGLDVSLITADVIEATRASGDLPRAAVLEQYRHLAPQQTRLTLPVDRVTDLGSNNWVVGGAMSPTGKPIVSNDPHRAVTNPSLRYIVHLNAPGWNAIGASQPPYLGVSIGHNETLAWGLTITGTDFQDVFVEELNPANDGEVLYNGRPEPLRVITEEVPIKGEQPRRVDLLFSRHGPVFHVDKGHHKAYALRSAFTEPGTASYLASLKLSQAKTCQEFLDLAIAWKANSENLICGDVDGNIGFQASGYAPVRKGGWLGRLPVPGTGKYEWDGFRTQLPREYNPPRGFIATANHNINTQGYWPPVVFKTTSTLPYDRITRILQVIKPGQMFSMDDSRALQRDIVSLRGLDDQKMFRGWTAKDPDVERARDMVANWNGLLEKDAVPPAIYITWRRITDQAGGAAAGRSSSVRAAVEAHLGEAIQKLEDDYGPDWTTWRYGRVHTQTFQHPVLEAFDLPAVERRGGNGAVGADGASYREIIDVSNWDNSLTINTPGQSGQPESPYYGNLLPLWSNDEYFPMAFSRQAVDAKAAHKLALVP